MSVVEHMIDCVTMTSTDPARALLETTLEHARAENRAAYGKAEAARDFWEYSVGAAIEDPTLDPADVQYSAIEEVAVALGVSRRNADALITIGGELHHRFPTVHDAFAEGRLDYARVATIISVLGAASAETVAAAQEHLLPLEFRYTPGPLRAALWRLWFRLKPDEARRQRDQNIRTSRTAYVRKGGNGTAWLTACISDLEGAEAQRLIDEIADTVCSGDPRSVNERRADGLMALLHGESALPCRCGDDDCAMAGVEAPHRRKHLVQILIDIKTLLGLSNKPATLEDGTPLPAEVARVLATDSVWQAIFTDLAHLAPATTTDPAPLGPVGRGRVHKAGVVPTWSGTDRPDPESESEPSPVSVPPPMRAAAPTATRRLGDPYSYRPSAALVALVRAMYPTCTFAGCSVPSRKCEIDHIDPFNHGHPHLGGLTVLGNLQPLCKRHHALKTKKLWACRRTPHGVVWTSPTGIERIALALNLPANFAPNRDTEPHSRFGYGYVHPDDVDAELDNPTWWETVVGDLPGPTLKDIAAARDQTTRGSLQALRGRYLKHRRISLRRADLAPPDF